MNPELSDDRDDVRAKSPLIGTWRLVSVKFQLITGESVDMYGPDPLGYLIITERRFTVIETARERQADLDSMIAYSGRYRVTDANHFVVFVDVAWHPSWINTEQVRAFEIEGDFLTVTTVNLDHPSFPGRKGAAVIRWRRELAP